MVNRPVTVWGRNVPVPLSTSSVAKFTFEELCGKNLSASDYLAITKQFQTVFVTDVPQLDLNSKDMARRFILFIDSAYEVRLVALTLCSSLGSLLIDGGNNSRQKCVTLNLSLLA